MCSQCLQEAQRKVPVGLRSHVVGFGGGGKWLLTSLSPSVGALLKAKPGGSDNTVASEGSLRRTSQFLVMMRLMS